MEQSQLPGKSLGFEAAHHGSLVCWRSVAAGVLVTILVYMVLTALGAGIGGFSAAHVLEKGGDIMGLTSGAGIWLGASAIISVFLGSYFATRFSDVTQKQIGACQAIVITAIFFVFLAHGSGSFFGSMAGVSNNLSGNMTNSDADTAARAVGDAGWLLFVTLVGSLLAAIFGGIEGAIGNIRKPFRRSINR